MKPKNKHEIRTRRILYVIMEISNTNMAIFIAIGDILVLFTPTTRLLDSY